jgi:hypothetical protein
MGANIPDRISRATAEEILNELSVEEKVALCGAQDWWRTVSIRRNESLLLPHIKVCFF